MIQEDGERFGYRGNRGVEQGNRDQERFNAGKGVMGNRPDPQWGQQIQQGSWNQSQQGARGQQQGGWNQVPLGGRAQQQGSWMSGVQGGRGQGQYGVWNRVDRHYGHENWRDGGRDRGQYYNEGTHSNPLSDVKCFRCLETGHHQTDCQSEPVYKCKQKGHMAVDCKSLDSKRLKMYGFGIPGQGFLLL